MIRGSLERQSSLVQGLRAASLNLGKTPTAVAMSVELAPTGPGATCNDQVNPHVGNVASARSLEYRQVLYDKTGWPIVLQ